MKFEDIIEREIEIVIGDVMYEIVVTRILKCDRTDFILVNAVKNSSFSENNVQFGNDYILPFQYNGIEMDSVTRAFWYAMYKLIGDTETCATIMKLKSPNNVWDHASTKYPRDLKNMNIWSDNTLRIMYSVQVAKFKDRKALISALAFTGTIPILALDEKDDFYGCIFDETGRIKGRNKLGNILMKVRDLFRSQSSLPEVNMSGRFE